VKVFNSERDKIGALHVLVMMKFHVVSEAFLFKLIVSLQFTTGFVSTWGTKTNGTVGNNCSQNYCLFLYPLPFPHTRSLFLPVLLFQFSSPSEETGESGEKERTETSEEEEHPEKTCKEQRSKGTTVNDLSAILQKCQNS